MNTITAPSTYTPTTSTSPTFEQSGASDSALQQTNNLINTSNGSRTTTAASSSALASALANFNISNTPTTNTSGSGSSTDTTPATIGTLDPNDPYVASLNALSANSDTASKLLISNIMASKQTQANAVDDQYDNYKRGLQLLGIQHNEAQSTPDLLAGHINQAEDQHQQKLQTIDQETNKALATAQQAQDTNDFKTLNAQMAYVKQLNAEKATTLKSYNDAITAQPKIAADVAHNVYATMQTLDPADQETFIQSVAQQYNLPLGTLVTALTDEQGKQTVATTKAASAQATADAKNVLTPAEAKTLGVPYGTTVAAAQKMGITPTSKSTGTSGTGSISKTQIDAVKSKLIEAKGTDGHTDPFLYQQAYQDWTAKGGSTAAFVKAYPPKDYVNPAATNLPAFLMPPTTKTSSSRTS